MIDLRSDTVTLPPVEMREKMCVAEVGDDARGEDPTVKALEELAAHVTGHEAAMFVMSGTMGNLVAMMTHCDPGQAVIMGPLHHPISSGVGNIDMIARLLVRYVPHKAAGYDLETLERAIRPEGMYDLATRLVWLENTFNLGGGLVLAPNDVEGISSKARAHNLLVHMDGARVFNAASCLGVEVKEITKHVDSVMFCLSKGLAAPLGSLLCGSTHFISRARMFRRAIGGGMRQAGIIAAAGIYAIEHMSKRLQEDHDNAKVLAYGLMEMPDLELDPPIVQTNMLYVRLRSDKCTASEFAEVLGENGLLVSHPIQGRIRMVTHYGIEREHISQALDIVRSVIAA
jgi:threonine aldolase